MDHILLNVLFKISRWTSLRVNGLIKKGEELNMIAMPRISSLNL